MKIVRIAETESEAVGLALDVIRKRHGWDQMRLSELMCIGQATVHRILNGKSDLRITQVHGVLTLDEFGELFDALDQFQDRARGEKS